MKNIWHSSGVYSYNLEIVFRNIRIDSSENNFKLINWKLKQSVDLIKFQNSLVLMRELEYQSNVRKLYEREWRIREGKRMILYDHNFFAV